MTYSGDTYPQFLAALHLPMYHVEAKKVRLQMCSQNECTATA